MPPSRLGPSNNNNNNSKGSSNLSVSSIPPFSHQQQKQGGGGGSNSEERNGAISPDKVVVPERIQASKISGPQGGAPIPAGFKFGAKDEMPERDRKAKSGRWGFGFGKMGECKSRFDFLFFRFENDASRRNELTPLFSSFFWVS